MDKKKVPYNTQVQFAILAGKSDEAHDVIGRALAEMGNGALEFARAIRLTTCRSLLSP